ncbi:MAG TPA: hypothetical protein VN736_29145 [Candidatus Limnocylindrales bacterium]|nr:hypothetical protein [Candidatus Limnocylindrales bacterium]
MKRSKPTNRFLRNTDFDAARAEILVGFLNEPDDGSELRFRVLQIFRMCREMREESVRQNPSILRPINAHLEEFSFTVSLSFRGEYELNWRPAPYVQHSTAPEPLNTARLRVSSPSAAVMQVLEMQMARSLDRIRECRCGKWFFARTNKKAVCSDRCRLAKHREDEPEAYRKDRADYMRKWRIDKKHEAERKAKAEKRTNNAKRK